LSSCGMLLAMRELAHSNQKFAHVALDSPGAAEKRWILGDKVNFVAMIGSKQVSEHIKTCHTLDVDYLDVWCRAVIVVSLAFTPGSSGLPRP